MELRSTPVTCCPPRCTCCQHPTDPHPSPQLLSAQLQLSSSSSSLYAGRHPAVDSDGWVQVRVVNGSDDHVWWNVACHPETETVGQLRQRLIKGAGTFVPILYRSGEQLADRLTLREAGVNSLSVLSSGRGASLVYGKKAAAATRKSADSGHEIVEDRFESAEGKNKTSKQRWNTSTNAAQVWMSPSAQKHQTDGKQSSSPLRYLSSQKHSSQHRTRSDSSHSSSSASSSCSSSNTSHRHRTEKKHRHRRHQRRESERPAMIMPVAVCRCHADPVLYPVMLSGHTAGSPTKAKAAEARKGAAATVPSKQARVRSVSEANASVPNGQKTNKRLLASPRGSSQDSRASKKTVKTVSQVLDEVLPPAAKTKQIGIVDASSTTERAHEVKELKRRIKALEDERRELQHQLGIGQTIAPKRTGLRTPPFPVDTPPEKMFLNTSSLTTVAAPQTLQSMFPAGFCGASAGVHLHGQHPIPHYIHHGVPVGLHPYSATQQWIASMPPSSRAVLEQTVTQPIAFPGLLKVSAPLYPTTNTAPDVAVGIRAL